MLQKQKAENRHQADDNHANGDDQLDTNCQCPVPIKKPMPDLPQLFNKTRSNRRDDCCWGFVLVCFQRFGLTFQFTSRENGIRRLLMVGIRHLLHYDDLLHLYRIVTGSMTRCGSTGPIQVEKN